MDTDLLEILNRSLEGKPPRPGEAYALIDAGDKIFEPLMRTAVEIRARHFGNNIAYSRKAFIPLTFACRDYCGYCSFRIDPKDVDSAFMKLDDVAEVAEAADKRGCKEALFTLGEKPETKFPVAAEALKRMGYASTIEYLRDACELVLKKTQLLPHSNPGIMTKTELALLKPANASMGLMLENISDRLMQKGGPHEFAPTKNPKLRISTILSAGELKIPFTTGILVGIGETSHEIVDSLYAILKLHEEYGHIQEVIVQNFRAKPETPMAASPEPTQRYMMKIAAIARLIFGGSMNIQVPPNLTSDTYGDYVDAGINDWGGISPLTMDFINPEAPWPEIASLGKITSSKGCRLRERLSVYPEYILKKREYLPKELANRIGGLASSDGYAKTAYIA